MRNTIARFFHCLSSWVDTPRPSTFPSASPVPCFCLPPVALHPLVNTAWRPLFSRGTVAVSHPKHCTDKQKAEVLTSDSVLIPATEDNKELLLTLFADVLPRGSTNFEEVRIGSGNRRGVLACCTRFTPRGKRRDLSLLLEHLLR